MIPLEQKVDHGENVHEVTDTEGVVSKFSGPSKVKFQIQTRQLHFFTWRTFINTSVYTQAPIGTSRVGVSVVEMKKSLSVE